MSGTEDGLKAHAPQDRDARAVSAASTDVQLRVSSCTAADAAQPEATQRSALPTLRHRAQHEQLSLSSAR
jgi:hypothetical protein